MAMNVKNRGVYFQSNDYCRNYSSQAIHYGNNNHFFPRLPGPESLLKPPLELMCQAPPPFQPAPPPQALGPPPDPLHFPLPAPLTAKPLPHLPLPPGLPPSLPPSPKPLEEEGQGGPTEQDPTLEELCKPLYCKLCNVTLNSAQQAQAHYQGKNHSKKLRNFYAGSQQPPPVRIPEALEPVAQQPQATPPAESAAPCKQAVFKGASRVILATESDYCKLCDASFSSPTIAQAHYQGKNHAKRLRLSEAQLSPGFLDSSEANQRRPRKEGAEFKLMKTRRNTHLPPSLPGTPASQPARAVLQPATAAANPARPGHVCDAQRPVLLLHVQHGRGRGGGVSAAPGEQAAQEQGVRAALPQRDGDAGLHLSAAVPGLQGALRSLAHLRTQG